MAKSKVLVSPELLAKVFCLPVGVKIIGAGAAERGDKPYTIYVCPDQECTGIGELKVVSALAKYDPRDLK